MRRAARRWRFGIALAGLAAGCGRAADADPRGGPLVITRGGSYSGQWASDDPDVAAVTVRTAEPVLIEHASLTGRGPLIAVAAEHADVTVRETVGTGQNPGIVGRPPGRFLTAESFDRVTVEHCRLVGTAGIYLLTNTPGHEAAVRVIANRAEDIDGRCSDGRGGWLGFNDRKPKGGGRAEHGYVAVQFLQLDKVRGPGMEVAWNEVVNAPGRSRVEDNLSVYDSGGTAASPLSVHDNCVRGAYTIDPARGGHPADADRAYSWDYSGGGLMLGDGATPAFVRAVDNVVVGTANYGIAVAAGHDITFDRNRIVSAGVLPDGRPVAAQNVGAYVWDAGHGKHPFYGDGGTGNVIGWVKGRGRNDSWTPDAGTWVGTVPLADPVTPADEEAAVAEWTARAKRVGVTVGPTTVR